MGPETYLQAYLQDHRVSYLERLKSLDKQRRIWNVLEHKAETGDLDGWARLGDRFRR